MPCVSRRRFLRYFFLVFAGCLVGFYGRFRLKPFDIPQIMGSSQSRVKTLDGTTLEGGGGLIRNALAFSSIFNKPIHIHSIRAGRPGVGGLRPEHTVAVDVLSSLTLADVTGNVPASRDLGFRPHASTRADTTSSDSSQDIDVTVEGSASIFLVAMLPYVLFSHLASKAYQFQPRFDQETEINLIIRAGTLCVKAPSIFYMQQVFIPTLELIGIGRDHFTLGPEHEQGWHTASQKFPGKMVAHIKPLTSPLSGFVLPPRGSVRSIQVTAHVPTHTMGLFKQVLHDEFEKAVTNESHSPKITIDVLASVPDDQYHLLIAATAAEPSAYLGYEQVYPQSDVFPKAIEGDEKQIAIYLIRSCIHGLWVELRHGNSVDEHMEDLLAVYQSLAAGFSAVTSKGDLHPVFELSNESPAIASGKFYEIQTGSKHRETTSWMVEQFTGLQPRTKSISNRDHVGYEGIGLGR